jgi:type IV secretory pathway VirB10-like protein
LTRKNRLAVRGRPRFSRRICPLDLDPNRDPKDQHRKLSFLNSKQDDRAIYNPRGQRQPAPSYEVMAGTLIRPTKS